MMAGKKYLTIPAAVLTVAAVAAGTAFFGSHLGRFSLDATTDSLVLQSDPDLAFYNATREVFGSDEYVIVAFSANDRDIPLSNLRRLAEVGLEAWLAEQEARWRCPACRKPVDTYSKTCRACGAPLSR